ncbi:MAG: glycosyltransferase, partial [Calditrichaeota bacterium]|nr:glycosyltransferase [Calditrichota bacterium]
LLAGLLRIRHVASIMGQDAQAGNRYLKWFRWRRMTITAPSEFAAKTFRESTGQAAPQIIPIGLAEDDRPEAAAQRDIDILGVGALTALKNYRLFIELVERLRPEFPELRGAIIGEGPERAALEAQIAGKGLQGHVRLAGQLSRPEVLAQMARSRILLHPSSYESQGYVLMEALYCGMAVVCLPVGYTVPSERMRVCRDAAEMGRELADLLRQHLPPQSLLLKPIAETVNAFQELYR